jgi:hypothetical protein
MNRYLFAILLFSLMSFSLEKNLDATKSRLSKTEQYLYNGSSFYKTVESYYYSQNKLDSIVNILTDKEHDDWPVKEAFTFIYNSNTVDVYIEGRYYPKATKIRHYAFNSDGNLSKILIFENDRITCDQTYSYDKQNKTIKVETIDSKRFEEYNETKESIYYMSDSNNIDSTYEYIIRNKQREVDSREVFKYDSGPNPFKNLIYHSISESFFNSNNCVSYQFLDSNHDNKVHKESYKYDNKSRLLKNFDDDIYESDSIVTTFKYLD